MEKINSLSLDLETFSDVDLNKCGVYKYVYLLTEVKYRFTIWHREKQCLWKL